LRSWYSDWLRAGRQRGRSSSPGRVKNFLFSTSSRPAVVSTQPPTKCVPEALSSELKRPGREADHSPPTGAEVKQIWIYTTTSSQAFMAYEQLYLYTEIQQGGRKSNEPSKTGIQVRKSWCLMSSCWVGWGGGNDFRTWSVTDIKFISSQKA
jgi:hypothetical protein